MKIVKLKSENVKRLEAVLIEPDDSGLVVIGGKNGAGKSSVLDSIMYAIGGGKAIPGEPVRKGQKKAEVKVKLRSKDGKDLIVTRTMKSDGSTGLTVTSPDGAKFPSPQSMLDALYGSLTFDPEAFCRMKPSEQLESLKRLAGVGDQFAALASKRQAAYDRRTEINREIKLLDGQIAGLPEPTDGLKPVNVAALLESRKLLEAQKSQKAIKRIELDQARHQFDGKSRDAAHLKATIDQMRIDLSKLEAAMTKATADVDAAEKVADAKASEFTGLQEPDFASIDKDLAGAQAINAKVDAANRRAETQKKREALEVKAKDETNIVEGIDDAKVKIMAGVKLPVDGLGFGDNGVTYNGVPFEQASSAERLRVSVAMGMAMNSELRVMLLRDASLLDDDNMAMIRDMAKSNDYQLWVERVGTEGCQVVIEDGHVRGDVSEPSTVDEPVSANV